MDTWWIENISLIQKIVACSSIERHLHGVHCSRCCKHQLWCWNSCVEPRRWPRAQACVISERWQYEQALWRFVNIDGYAAAVVVWLTLRHCTIENMVQFVCCGQICFQRILSHIQRLVRSSQNAQPEEQLLQCWLKLIKKIWQRNIKKFKGVFLWTTVYIPATRWVWWR